MKKTYYFIMIVFKKKLSVKKEITIKGVINAKK